MPMQLDYVMKTRYLKIEKLPPYQEEPAHAISNNGKERRYIVILLSFSKTQQLLETVIYMLSLFVKQM